MLGNTLVTKQTGPAGKQVNRLYIEDGADIDRELYLSHAGRPRHRPVAFVVSTEGGMDIEAVAHDTPEKIVTVAIDPATGVTAADAAASPSRWARRRTGQGCVEAVPDPLQGLRREGHEPCWRSTR
jgi:succinyl-CoA synthetase beta subunit